MAAIAAELGTRFCRRCDYCQPCPQGIPISSIMNIGSFIKRLPPERLFSAGRIKAVQVAETCIDCGECESRCPYELPIREIMEENIAAYKEQMALHGVQA